LWVANFKTLRITGPETRCYQMLRSLNMIVQLLELYANYYIFLLKM
jgi:hypothetical protein